jgi:uncharacterized membrane protein
MEIKSLFGLPAHPFVVHAVVVLLPLAALATVITALMPAARRHYAPLALGLAVAAALSAFVAQGSGEELEHQVDESRLVEQHADRAEQVLPWSIGLAVAAAAIAAAERAGRRYPKVSPKTLTAVLVTAAVITAAGSTWSVARAGHRGARATWGDLPPASGERGGGERDGD